MNNGNAVQLFAVSGLVSFLLCFPVYQLLVRWNIVDRPNARSSHSQITVRGGGIAILAAFAACVFLTPQGEQYPVVLALFVGSMGLAVVSFIDDFKALPPALRFACHAFAALLALWALRSHSLVVGLSEREGWELFSNVGWAFAFLWLAGYTNAFNFMDGINGLAAGQTVFTAIGSGILTAEVAGNWSAPPVLLAFTLAGATAGFLPHNFPRARMFMGDVSSSTIGFLLAAIALWMAADFGGWLLIPLGLLHANFVLDTAITLGRRIARGERWYEPHREHFYQRLVRSGKSHAFVTGTEMGLQAVVLGMLLFYGSNGVGVRVMIIIATLAIWLLFFAYCERRFRGAMKFPAPQAAG